MTLSEILDPDDLVALETSWFCLLPKLDASGRQLVTLNPSRHKRQGYSTENMVSSPGCALQVFLNLLHSCYVKLLMPPLLAAVATVASCMVRGRSCISLEYRQAKWCGNVGMGQGK